MLGKLQQVRKERSSHSQQPPGKAAQRSSLKAAILKCFNQHMIIKQLFAAFRRKCFSPLEACVSLLDHCLIAHYEHNVIAKSLRIYLLYHYVFPAKFPLFCLSKIYQFDKVVVQVLLQEEENLTPRSLDFSFLSHFDAISSS